MSCNSSSTFVRVIKVGEKYSYIPFLGCGTKKNGKAESVTKLVPESDTEYEMNTEYCTGTEENNLSITTTPLKSTAFDKKQKKTKLTITSGTGINTLSTTTPTKTGYTFTSGKEWIRSGSTTTYNQASGYKATDFCPNLTTQSQSVTLKVNWRMVKPSTPTISNPKDGVWSNKNVTIDYSTTTPKNIIGKWYYNYSDDKTVKEWTALSGKTSISYKETNDQNHTLYIWVCNKNASEYDDSSNCSSKATTKIMINKTPPVLKLTGFEESDWSTLLSYSPDYKINPTAETYPAKYNTCSWLSYEFTSSCSDNLSGCESKKYVIYSTSIFENKCGKYTGDLNTSTWVFNTDCNYSSGAGNKETYTYEWVKIYDKAGNQSNIIRVNTDITWC